MGMWVGDLARRRRRRRWSVYCWSIVHIYTSVHVHWFESRMATKRDREATRIPFAIWPSQGRLEYQLYSPRYPANHDVTGP